jgi:hypothetical protein
MSAIAFLKGNAALPASTSNGSATTHQIERSDNPKTAQEIWLQAGDPRGTVGEQYLRQRGLSIPDDVAGDVLRFHGRLHLGGRHYGGLIALFRDLKTNDPRGIQRTFLAPDGSKIGRSMLGPVKGAAIKLDADAEVTSGLHIGEGLETCLAARELGFCPAWAVGSAGGIRAFPVLAAIECLSILIETDDTGANRSAAGACARRWQEAGREVLMVVPQLEGDMNDVLLKVSL